ncbi:3-isopropylmalate dehydrogenase [Arthrobacter alpinus]|uniref:3-isopropylmalate dehydrogenase n=1 Tax=Arthrobacter alpinus TaxID=656366 RepID=A0A1H5IJA3_9MICC|nr:3-isopropylmalate dehydrogenase [Arthrobacter alpinus]SEE39588.1 3-isopropylmalate dehydrogenase [Arthrobacter alpinus]
MTGKTNLTHNQRHYRLAVVPGDGIGPEVTQSALTVLDAAEQLFGFTTERDHIAAGAKHYVATGELFSPGIEERLRANDAILFGSMGDPSVAPGILERGFILTMRQAFEQAVNLRPVRLYPGVKTPIAGLTPDRCDLVIVRENTEGAYVGRGSTVHAGTPNAVAVQESVNTRAGVERVVDYAFRLASARRKKLTLCHKTNILVEAGKLWQDTVHDLAAKYPDVELDYVHVDAMCFHLPIAPERFDVVVTDNLFGDIITDLGAVIQGGLGVASSANLNLDDSAPSMFEAIHGSAPDIAGKGYANPAGAILSLAMCLAHLGEDKAALAVESATVNILGTMEGLSGPDMGGNTQEIGQRVAEALKELAAGDQPLLAGMSVMEGIKAAATA